MKLVRLVPAAVVVLALAVIGAAAQLNHPAASTASAVTAARQVPVTSAIRACPPTMSGTGTIATFADPAATATATSASSASSATKATAANQATLTSLPVAGVALHTPTPVTDSAPGALSLLTVPAASTLAKKPAQVPTGWSVGASGSMAQAVEAEVAQSSGLATVRCGGPGSQLWFIGPGQLNGGSHIQLDLMNVDALPASVNLNMITDAGPVQSGNYTGITVPPHQSVIESLSAAAANSSVLSIEVHTSTGRVAAAVSEGTGTSTSWLSGTTAPATTLVIPGVPPSSTAAGLFLTVPGSANAKVNVVAITAQGQYKPFGAQSTELPGQSASYMALTPLGGTAAALEITSNVPVTAAVMVPGSGAGAFTAATAPISQQAVIAGSTSGSGFAASVVLSAPAGAARVRLTEIAPSGAKGATTSVTASQNVSVRAAHTLVTSVAAPSGAKGGAAFSIVITPLAGSGPVYAARVQTHGQSAVVSIIPAVSALTTITLPPVRDSYDAIVP